MGNDELQASVGQFRAKLVGTSSIYIFLLALALAWAGYITWDMAKYNREQNITEHETINKGLTEMVYVLTLTEEERKDLNLTMPDSLRGKRSK